MPADLIVHHAAIHTMSARQPQAEALAIEAGRIIWAGSNEAASGHRSLGTRVIDLQGQTVLPGFIDAHQHQLYMGLSHHHINARPGQVKSIAEILSKVADRTSTVPTTTWIEAFGYHDARLAERRNPTRWDLDQAAPDHPVLLTRTCGHVMVVNSRTLALAGVDRHTVDPAGGSIDRDLQTGEPTGVLRESAMALVRRVLPGPSASDLRRAILEGAAENLKCGITTVWEPSIEPDHLDAYRKLHANDALPIRVIMAHKKVLRSGEEVPIPAAFRTDSLSLRAIKLFQDGGFGAATAALTTPYSNEPSSTGQLIWEQTELNARVWQIREAGLDVSIHAIGDAAITSALDAMEASIAPEGASGLLRIEHCGLPLPPIPDRIHALGVIPVMQPVFLWFDGDVYAERVGADRARWLYPVRSLLDRGISAAGSSDGPVVPDINPLLGVYAAAARRSNSGREIAPEECINVQEALQLYTSNAAAACGESSHRGTLEPGKAADFIVLQDDPLCVPLEDLPGIPINQVFINGQEVAADT